MKNKIITIFLLCMLVNMSVPKDYSNIAEEENDLIDINQEISETKIMDAPATNIKTDVEPLVSYEGESLLIQHDYKPSYVGYDGYWQDDMGYGHELYSMYNIEHARVDNALFWVLGAVDTLDGDNVRHEIAFRLKAYNGGGVKLRFSMLHNKDGGGVAWSSNYYFEDNKYGLDTIDPEGYIYLRVETYCTDTAYSAKILRHLANGTTIWFGNSTSSNSWTHGNGQPASIQLRILYLVFEADTIEEHTRSEYKYTTNFASLGHKVSFQTKPYEYANISYPIDWTFSSINPILNYTNINYRLDVLSLDYFSVSVLFTSKCTNQLTIKDVSTDYLTNVGFETGEYLNDWHLLDGELSTDISIATNIVSGGYYSLRIDKNATSDYLILRMFNHKYYNTYVSFDIYYDSRTAGDYLQLAYHDYTSWLYESLKFETDRWYKCFFYLDNVQSVEFYSKASTDVFDVYIDNFKVWQTSTTISTISPSEYYFSSMMTAWDGYKNPPIPYSQVNFQLNQRTLFDENHQVDFDNTQPIFETSATTNEYGIASVVYEAGLMQEEYELLTWSWDNWFLPDQVTMDEYKTWHDTGLERGWTLGYERSGTETHTLTETEKGYTWQIEFAFDVGGHTTAYLHFYLAQVSSDYNGMAIDFMTSYIRSNNSVWCTDKKLLVDDWSLETSSNTTDDYYSSDWEFIQDDLNYRREWHSIYDRDDLYSYMFYNHPKTLTANDFVKIEIANFHFIHAQHYYFTPPFASELDYDTVYGDAVDFTEGDFEECHFDGGAATFSVENGYLKMGLVADYQGVHFRQLSTEGGYYNYFVFRARANITIDKIYLDYRDENHLVYVYNVKINTYWETQIFAVPIEVYDNLADITLKPHGDWSTYPIGIDIDYFQLIHRDYFLEETNDYATDDYTQSYSILDTWDFEEYGVLDGWTESVGGQTIWVEDGSLVVDITSADAYTRLKTYPAAGLSIDASIYTQIVITIKGNEDNLRIYFAESGNQAITSITPIGVANVFHTLVFDIDDPDWSGTETTLYLWLYDSSGNFENDEFFWIEEIRLHNPEELTYTTIQNSVLLESETNDLQYAVYVDWNLIGTFPDLSLIPLPQEVGTHYFQVQPFRTDEAYITQNIYTYYYTVEPTAFSVNVESFYLSDLYVNTYVTSNYDGTYIVYEDDTPIDSGTLHKEGTTIITNRDVTPAASINYTIAFTYLSEMVSFQAYYNNPSSDFFVTAYSIDIDVTMTVTWDTSKNTIDSLTIIEDGVTKVTDDPSSPTTWPRSTEAGSHHVTLIFEATDYNDVLFSFVYTIGEVIDFSVNVQNYYLTDNYVNTYFVASHTGTYIVYENDGQISSDSFTTDPLTISTVRDTTAGATINYSISFDDGSTIIWFNTTYQNAAIEYYLTNYAHNVNETNVNIYWNTSLECDYATLEIGDAWDFEEGDKEDVHKYNYADDFVSDGIYSYDFSAHVGSQCVTGIGFYFGDNKLILQDYNTFKIKIRTNQSSYDFKIYGLKYHIDTGKTMGQSEYFEVFGYTMDFDTLWTTLTFTSNEEIEIGSLWIIITPYGYPTQDTQDGDFIFIDYIKFVHGQVSVIEDGVEKVSNSLNYPVSYTKNTTVGTHYVSVIFECYNYKEIIIQFEYVIYAEEMFSVLIESFYVSDDYLNIYATSNFDYSYIVYENTTEIGSGNGVTTGTFIISPKNREAGLYNFTIVFTYGSQNITFMTWYSNLVPPLHPLNDLYREQSEGFLNITFHSNLEFYWIDIYHDGALIIDDSTETFFSIEKDMLVGWHNITLHYIYNCSTDADGRPVAEYNTTLVYEAWYETRFFYDVRIRYVPEDIGLAIGDFNINWVKTYFDGELVVSGDVDDVEAYSNYTFITNYDIRIRNTIASHELVVRDLHGTLILETTIDISSFAYQVIELPIYRLGVINFDNKTHKFGVKYLPWSDNEWMLSPELPQGVFIEFWFCGGTYGFRIYSYSEYIDANNVTRKLWNDWVDLPPGILPMVIRIPLIPDIDPDDDYIWWQDPVIYGPSLAGMALILGIIIWSIVKVAKRRKMRRRR